MQVSDTESESEENNEVGAKRLQDDAADINRLRKKYKNEIPKIPNSIVSSFLTQIDEKLETLPDDSNIHDFLEFGKTLTFDILALEETFACKRWKFYVWFVTFYWPVLQRSMNYLKQLPYDHEMWENWPSGVKPHKFGLKTLCRVLITGTQGIIVCDRWNSIIRAMSKVPKLIEMEKYARKMMVDSKKYDLPRGFLLKECQHHYRSLCSGRMDQLNLKSYVSLIARREHIPLKIMPSILPNAQTSPPVEFEEFESDVLLILQKKYTSMPRSRALGYMTRILNTATKEMSKWDQLYDIEESKDLDLPVLTLQSRTYLK